MKKIKLLVVMAALALVSAPCFADGLGYINYEKVLSNYDLAKNVARELDAKGMELQQYLMDKEKQYKNIDSPINKKNFEDQVQKDFKAKNDEFTKLKMKRAEEVENNILKATQAVAAEKRIDVVLDYRVIFTGGTDLSQDVINYLNSGKLKSGK